MPLYQPPSSSGAPTDADYLTGTANAGLSAEIAVGSTPGGELGGTWASPTVDATHSGSAHHAQSHAHSAAGDGTTLTPAVLTIPSAASPAQTAEGSAVWDSDDDQLTVGTGAARKTMMNVGDAPTAHATSHKSAGSDVIKLNEFAAPTADVDLNSKKLTSVTDPASPQDAATKAYVDATVGAAGGLSDHGVVTYLDYQVAAAPATPAAGYVRHYALTGKHMYQKDDAGATAALDSAGGSVSVAVIQDQKSSGTDGGNFASGAWRTRDLNTEVSDINSIVTIAANQFTPIAGTYLVKVHCPAYNCDRNQTRIQNITAASTTLTGSSGFGGASGVTESIVDGAFAANGTDAYEVQHQCQTTNSLGFGVAGSFGTEVYTSLVLTKIA